MKVEIEVVKQQSPEQEQEREFRGSFIDLNGEAKRLGLNFFSYKKFQPGQDHLPEKDRNYKLVWFIHERGETTGVSFTRKREMAEMVVNYAARRACDSATSLVQFAGAQGYRLLTTMSAEQLAEKQRKRAEQEALRTRIEEGHTVTEADLNATGGA
jgi:hypothetical protein